MQVVQPGVASYPNKPWALHDLVSKGEHFFYNTFPFSVGYNDNSRVSTQILTKIYRQWLKNIIIIKFSIILTKLKKRLLLRCIQYFDSNLINNIDNILISGT